MRVSRELRRPLMFVALISCLIGLYVISIPPVNILTVLLFLLLAGSLVYGFSRLLLRKRYSLFVSFFAVSLLFLKALDAFDTINTILLISLFVGLFTLLK